VAQREGWKDFASGSSRPGPSTDQSWLGSGDSTPLGAGLWAVASDEELKLTGAGQAGVSSDRRCKVLARVAWTAAA
jgi:hypothetical protein